MSNIDKQALREAAVRAGGGKWIYIRTLSLSSAYITEETGATVINCTAGDVPAKCAGFLELANPDTVLALLDENLQLQRDKDSLEAVAIAMRDDMRDAREKLEDAENRIAEHNFENRLLANADRDIKALRQRIAELEARTVTLPEEKFCPSEYAGSQYWEETEVWNNAISACAVAIRAAGIGVKGE
ncbi:ead/Ea22-like family protein [Citrobacter werkmanii]|uniref:ead/Ea22-like family protein n=1 Tax=Citrobacter werkmanii TaxID=67827 RepID=UPI0015754822|nr:ead/Ea22-like family protein [Citrobacter werkmanii]NTY83112.1 ead/Ea22-like family protein [Citrobacter werkmanii]